MQEIATKADTAASRAHEAELKLVAYHAAVTATAGREGSSKHFPDTTEAVVTVSGASSSGGSDSGPSSAAASTDVRVAAVTKMAGDAEAALRRLNNDLGRSRSELLRLRKELATAKASTATAVGVDGGGAGGDPLAVQTPPRTPRTPASAAGTESDGGSAVARNSPSYALVAVSVTESRRLRQRAQALEEQVISLEKARKACQEQVHLLRQRLEEREERVATLSNELSSSYLSYKSLEAEFKDKVSCGFVAGIESRRTSCHVQVTQLRSELSGRTEEVHRLRRVLIRARGAATATGGSQGKPPPHPSPSRRSSSKKAEDKPQPANKLTPPE